MKSLKLVITKDKRIKMGDCCEKYGFKVVHAKAQITTTRKEKSRY